MGSDMNEIEPSGGNRKQLIEGIVLLSVADEWASARLEWKLDFIYRDEDGDECLCGQYPIKEVCVLSNRLNGKTAIVGNVCVNKFLGIPSDAIFKGLKKIAADITAAPTRELIVYAHERRWLNEWEYSFMTDTAKKRKLTGKQSTKRIEINQKILNRTTGERRR